MNLSKKSLSHNATMFRVGITLAYAYSDYGTNCKKCKTQSRNIINLFSHLRTQSKNKMHIS